MKKCDRLCAGSGRKLIGKQYISITIVGKTPESIVSLLASTLHKTTVGTRILLVDNG